MCLFHELSSKRIEHLEARKGAGKEDGNEEWTFGKQRKIAVVYNGVQALSRYRNQPRAYFFLIQRDMRCTEKAFKRATVIQSYSGGKK